MRQSNSNFHFDLFKLIISLVIIGIFLYLTFRIIQPFLFGFFWALMVVVTTWPMLISLQKRLFHKRYLAVSLMLIIIGAFFVIPTLLVILNVTKNAPIIIELVKNLSKNGLPDFHFLNDIPYFGSDLYEKWGEFSHNGVIDIMDEFQHYLTLSLPWIFEQLLNIGTFIFHCAVMLIFSALLYLKGEFISSNLYNFIHRLSPVYGVRAISLTGRSIRAVALGIVLTAAVLAILGGSSLALTNIPFPGFITILLFICCIVQIGPVFIMVLATIWQWYHGHTEYTIILIICALVLTTLDSVMRTLLIKKGVDLPFFLILFGVVGGMLAFGVVGLFIGPIMFALIHNFIRVWTKQKV